MPIITKKTYVANSFIPHMPGSPSWTHVATNKSEIARISKLVKVFYLERRVAKYDTRDATANILMEVFFASLKYDICFLGV